MRYYNTIQYKHKLTTSTCSRTSQIRIAKDNINENIPLLNRKEDFILRKYLEEDINITVVSRIFISSTISLIGIDWHVLFYEITFRIHYFPYFWQFFWLIYFNVQSKFYERQSFTQHSGDTPSGYNPSTSSEGMLFWLEAGGTTK
jgi:hypothetical protein